MKLLYFTNSYPYGIGEQWKANELDVLVKHFDGITVVPFSYSGNFDHPKPLPVGVQLEGPLFRNEQLKVSKKDIFKILFNAQIGAFIREFFRGRVYKDKRRFMSWFAATLNVIRLLRHPLIRKLRASIDKDTVLYFYWGKGACEILPFISNRSFHKSFVRMHRYDLFEYENNNYISYRAALLNSASVIAPSSIAGQLHLKKLHPDSKAQVKVFRCGTVGNGRLSSASNDGILRIVSCSLLSPVKRVHLMIESLQYITIPILWRHIGDGALRSELEKLAISLGVQDKFIFEGMMDSRTVLDFYSDNPLDLFINVSDSEGVPFSIMEAFSAGIPVIATGVGGTGEIVDDSVGYLLPKNVTPQQLAQKITIFYSLQNGQKTLMREEAYNRYFNSWNAEKLADELAMFLKS